MANYAYMKARHEPDVDIIVGVDTKPTKSTDTTAVSSLDSKRIVVSSD